MAEQRAVGRWMQLVGAGAAIVVLTMGAAREARAVNAGVQACCFAAGECQDLSPTVCEGQLFGTAQAPGTACATVTCPVLCSAAGPECNGKCDPGTTCVNPYNGQFGATTSAVSLCICVPQIPEGGSCAAQPDACAPGLSCVNGICALTPAPAPLLSTAGLGLALASLIALGGLAVVRRRHG